MREILAGERRSEKPARNRDRTDDLILTKDVLCQLSYAGDFLIGSFRGPHRLWTGSLSPGQKREKAPAPTGFLNTQISRNLFPRFYRKSGGKLIDAGWVSTEKKEAFISVSPLDHSILP